MPHATTSEIGPRPPSPWRPSSIVAVYTLVGALWIVFSDHLMVAIFGGSPETLQLVSAVKGEFYIAATAGILYLLLRTWEGRYLAVQSSLADARAVAIRDLRELQRVEQVVAESEATYRHIVGAIADVVWLASPETGQASFVSAAAARVYGVEAEALMKDPALWVRLVHPDDAWIFRAKAARVAAGESAWAEYRIVRPDGTVRWLLDRTNVIRSPDGRVARLVGIASDITDRRLAEEEMRLAANVFEQANEGIVVTDATERIVRVNQAFTRITGFEQAEITGQTPRRLASGRHDRAFYREMWETLRSTGHWAGEVWNKRHSGEVYPQWLTVKALAGPAGKVTHYVGIFSDLSERKRAEADIHRLAWYDPLTSLPNRALACERITQAIADTRREGGHVALLCLDVDRFKLINDSMGHAAGDAVLREVARRITHSVRCTDTVFRGSGAQFLVLLQRFEDVRAVGVVAAEVLEVMREPFAADGTELRLTASIGAALSPGDADDSTTLLKNAEAALYQAKSLGRNQCQFFTSALNSTLVERLRMENRLRVALERGEFEVHYQPQVEITTGTMLGVEALVRWRHPEDGLISPMKFIPIAEECGLIAQLGEWVLREACHAAVAWEATHGQPLRVAVNISAIQFRQPDFGDTVARVLAETGLSANLLELELTESIVMDGPTAMIRMLESLKTLGVQLSLDDFGTGYSSLAYLRRFPIDKLKIDRSFVSSALSNEGDAAIALAVIGIAKSLGLAVIAEGVETHEQARFLVRNGCAEAQGFLYARPMPIIELARWASRQAAA